MTELSRRHLLALSATGVLSATGALLAGCTPAPKPNRTPRMPTVPPSPATAADWSALARNVSGPLVRPGQSGYDAARVTENPRYNDARPLAVLTAVSAADVSASLVFARHHGVPLALRSGGHSYPGWSSGGAAGTGMPPSLVIDSRGMTDIAFGSNNAAAIGAGASLANVYSTLGSQGRALAAGSCATVGVTGLTLGGGVGVLVRAYGLSCDALTEVEIVTAGGAVRTANAKKNADLFWACRGGGGGHLGVVTKLTFATSDAPGVTMFYLVWPWGAAASVIDAWQGWAPTADRRLWSTLKLLGGVSHASGPGVFLSGTWIGPQSVLTGQLAPLLSRVGTAPDVNDAYTRDYRDAMLAYAGCSHIPIAECKTGPGGKLPLGPFSATSHIAYRKLNGAGISAVLTHVEAAQKVSGMTEGGISMDALGGAVSKVAPAATAFVHRKALMSVQYTATFAVGAEPAPYDTYVRAFRAAMTPSWGDGAYVNYADPTLRDPSAAYFGDNAARLAAVQKTYDPHGRFTQPQPY